MTKLFVTVLLLTALPTTADAQEVSKPAPVVEFALGRSTFVDDGGIHHTTGAVAGRWYLTPRVAIGPEAVYMVGPGRDRDLFLTGNVTFDLVTSVATRRRPVIPYVVAGAGLFRHSDAFGGASFTSYEGAFTAGGGVRAWFADRVYVAGEIRAGWEPHVRYSVHVGLALGDGRRVRTP
jgi:hypothetical protein